MSTSFPNTLTKELKALVLVTEWRCDFDLKTERLFIEKQDDGVGGNASTAENYRSNDFSDDNDASNGI